MCLTSMLRFNSLGECVTNEPSYLLIQELDINCMWYNVCLNTIGIKQVKYLQSLLVKLC